MSNVCVAWTIFKLKIVRKLLKPLLKLHIWYLNREKDMEIKRRNEEIAQQVVECWLEDCEQYIEKVGSIPDLNPLQLKLLLHHIEVGVLRGGEGAPGAL